MGDVRAGRRRNERRAVKIEVGGKGRFSPMRDRGMARG